MLSVTGISEIDELFNDIKNLALETINKLLRTGIRLNSKFFNEAN